MNQCLRDETVVRASNEPGLARVLVIDDDRSVSAAIQIVLARQGYDTVLAPDAYAGVQAFESSKFNLVIVDIFMPGMDGLETIKDFRERAPTMPILAMSGFRFRNSLDPVPDYLEIAAKLGATCCLRKPFAPQQLMVAINSCFDPAFTSDRSPGNRESGQGSMR